MSTATMWLLLFVVAALALLIAALTKTKFTVQKISIIGIMAALSFVAYEFFRIPNVFGTGSSFHLGNTFTALTAMLLDGVSGGLAGAIGLALADVVAGDPGYAITTFILKFIIGLVCGAVSHKVIHLRTFPTDNKLKYVAAVTASAFSGLLVNVFTDPFIGYFRNLYIFGQPAEFVSVVTKIASGVTLVNSLLSTVCAVVLYIALRPALEKAHLLPKEYFSQSLPPGGKVAPQGRMRGKLPDADRKRVLLANSALISPLRGQLQSPRQEPPLAVALRHAPAGAAPWGKAFCLILRERIC